MANRGAIASTQNPVDDARFIEWARSQGFDPDQAKVALSMGLLTDPTIQAQYKNDPRTQLGLKAIEAGSDMSPLKGGITEGLARVAQGFLGGRISRDQKAHYDDLQTIQNNRRDDAIARARGIGVGGTDKVASALTTLPAVDGAFQGSGMVKGVAQPGIPHPTEAPASGGGDFHHYNSKAYDPLEEKAAAEFGIPVELLRSVRLSGERSNADQVSSAGAGTVYQIIPKTARGIRRTYGFDPMSSPENSVRGAAAVLAENYKGAGGNIPETFARYIAGTGGTRGHDTQAYVGRTTNMFNQLKGSDTSIPSGSPLDPRQSSGTSSSESSTTYGANAGPPPVMAVPDLPKPMDMPERPTLPQKVRSMRMAIVDKLLADRGIPGLQNIDSSIINQFLPEGLNEEQKAAEQARQDEVDFSKTEYASKLGAYRDQQKSAYDSAVKSHDDAEAFNRGLTLEQYRAQLQSSETMRKERHDDIQANLNRQNALNVAAERGNKPTKIGEKARSDWRAIRTSRSDVDAMLNIVKDPSNEKHFGLQYKILGSVPFAGNKINQAVDPSGIKVRGVINNLRNTIVHARAGASQTGIELTQLDRFLPSDGDTAKELQDKIEGLRDFLDRANGVFENEYGKDAYRWTGGDVATPTTASTVAPPAPVVAPPRVAPGAGATRNAAGHIVIR